MDSKLLQNVQLIGYIKRFILKTDFSREKGLNELTKQT